MGRWEDRQTDRQTCSDMLRRNFSSGKQIGLYETNKHDRSHTLKSRPTVYCKNSFNLLLKYLTEKNSFRDEGSLLHIEYA